MSIEKVRAYFKPLGIEERIREFDVSSATVELAAVAVGVEGARIAKSLSLKVEDKHHRHGRRCQGGQQPLQGPVPHQGQNADP